MRQVFVWCAFLVLGLQLELVHSEPPAPALKPWVSRQTTFNIPFSVDLTHGAPREVQLFVSQDAGKTWHFYGRQTPTAKSFPFRASADGDLWFASRTIDPRRRVPPVEHLVPELHVQVDTHQPQIDFTAIPGSAGEVTTAWKISDTTLAADSLKIEYQASPSDPWRSVAIDRTKLWNTPSSVVGEMTWYPEGNADSVTIRAEVLDNAGNKAVVNRTVKLTHVANRPLVDREGSNPITTPVSQNSSSPTVNGVPVPTTRRDDLLSARATTDAPRATDGTASSYGPTTMGKYGPNGADSGAVGVVALKNERRNDVTTRTSLPPGERARMTNSLRFQLDYELDSVGPEGVDEVQLWGTKDFGNSWIRWSLDEDLRSPIEVEVEREGIYGLRVVIVGRNGLATPAPHSGDLADIWVGVDTTRPVARISSAIYGEGVHAGELDIRWEVVDESLGDRAITLLFSEHPTGPWTTIAAGLPNTSQYFWSVDPNTPRKIYLRLEVRDEAGNEAEHQLVEAISTTGLVPKAFIRSVRPVPKSDPPQEAFLRNRYYQSR